MKKLLAIAFLLFAGFNANAQGTWSTGMNEPDELKGTSGGPYYCYDIEGEGSFVIWNWDDFLFKINTDKGVFDVWYYKSTGTRFISISIGLYAMDGKLVDKLENLQLLADVTGRSAWASKDGYWYATRKKIKKMKHALKSGEGYIRILCARKSAPEFDVKIMPYVESSEVK